MHRKANRASFMGRANSSCLASTYGKLVAIEITLKDIMGAVADPTWQHNLPLILTSFADHRATTNPSATLNSLAAQLGNQLSQLIFQMVSGRKSAVPRHCYPHMRYLLHEWDGQDTKETDIKAVDAIADNIISTLKIKYGVSP
ncbi:hypothetical protein F6V25_14255 [Oryzomonas japonica]|uniref:Uncharacterized protein n=1 Tax=Oryzomonas japonica TaxID=2603858 RepID=A0A7J4ZMP6_9BACT|nr:hypothetical protein [Oryzomonas japonica]KAB0663973.1 hypothetical protein F6V25_14255 [Oryzomonas japonica]